MSCSFHELQHFAILHLILPEYKLNDNLSLLNSKLSIIPLSNPIIPFLVVILINPSNQALIVDLEDHTEMGLIFFPRCFHGYLSIRSN